MLYRILNTLLAVFFISSPQYGGNYCVGAKRRYQTCNNVECSQNTTDYRNERCAYLGPLRGVHNYKWVSVNQGM